MSVIQNHQVNILVVDPDERSRKQIHAILMEDGYATRAVGTAKDAIRSAEEVAPNLLICDVNLGEQSGIALFAELRAIAGIEIRRSIPFRPARSIFLVDQRPQLNQTCITIAFRRMAE